VDKDLERVFEPFQRGEADHTRHLPGLGLGLTITKLLTNTLGGELSVTSTYGKGSTFQVRLMLGAIDRPVNLAAPTRKIQNYTGPRRTLIVVDDNDDHCAMMREILSPLDFIVLTAKSGPECLTLIEGIRPDLYFIDIRMPEMNGWELVARLREKGEVAPIIMLSANIGDGTRPDTLPDNAHNDTLTKPFDIRQIHAKLAVHLGFEWIYEQGEENKAAVRPAVIDSPTLSDLHDLIRLGEIGYVRGIEAKLALLAQDENLVPFVENARDYIRAFNMSGYDMFLRNLEQKLDDQP
jgi:CheY-like chemotaxis protein